MSGYVCLRCGNAREFVEDGRYSQRMFQEVTADGYVETIDTDNDDHYETDRASCAICEEGYCIVVDDLEELKEHFDTNEKYEEFIEKMKNVNEITELRLERQKNKINIDVKMQESE